MSNLQYTLYRKAIRQLSETLLIKVEDEIDRINEDVVLNGGQVSHLPTTWKYYLNVSGQYHALDQQMEIVSLDTAQKINFTVDALKVHRNTAKAYQPGSTYYKELVRQYPNQVLLIRGILNPVDINVAIEADNYTILQYDRRYVEGNEVNLIPNLEQQIIKLMRRWHVKDYGLIDNLYLPAVMAVLHAQIPNLIESIRLENCHTYQVHSFHLWNYLDSFGTFSKYKSHLTTEQALWLYRNIRWLKANAGMQKVHSLLVDKLLTPLSIPLSRYTINQQVEDITETLMPSTILRKHPINTFGSISPEPKTVELDYILDKQVNLALHNATFVPDEKTPLMNAVSTGKLTQYPTKVYESDIIDQSERLAIRVADVLVQQWAYRASTGEYSNLLNVRNPDTGEAMAMNPAEAFVVWLWATNKQSGINLPQIPKLPLTMINKSIPPTIEQMRKVVSDNIEDDELQYLIDVTVDTPNLLSAETLNEYCQSVHKQMLQQRRHVHSVSDLKAYQYLRRVFELFYFHPTVTLTTFEDYQTLFNYHGWQMDLLSPSDCAILARDIKVAALGTDVDQDNNIVELQKAMLSIMAQLGTYDTQYIQTVNSDPTIVLDSMVVRSHPKRIQRVSKDRHKLNVPLNTVTSSGTAKTDLRNRPTPMTARQSLTTINKIGASSGLRAASFSEDAFRLSNPVVTTTVTGMTSLDNYYNDPNFMAYLLERATTLQ